MSVYRWIYWGVSIQVDILGCQYTGGYTGVSVYRWIYWGVSRQVDILGCQGQCP